MIKNIVLISCLIIPVISSAEIVKLVDGRTVDLKSNGTYEILQTTNQIHLIASGCKDHISTDRKKDDFGNIIGYKYFTGFSILYEIVNETDLPLAVMKLGTEFSKDYGMFYTLLKTPTFADPISPNHSLIMNRDPHLFYTSSKEELNKDQISELSEQYGCSSSNLNGQTIYVDKMTTKMKFPPESGNINPLNILKVTSKIEGLELKLR
jgi:hypothetical protein